MSLKNMPDLIKFFINGKAVTAKEDESIWEVSKSEGNFIPHLCHSNKSGYKADGNCRSCVVEIKGERTLAASCIRKPSNGMEVITNNDKVKKSQKLILELLLSDQPVKEKSHNQNSHFWEMIETNQISKTKSNLINLYPIGFNCDELVPKLISQKGYNSFYNQLFNPTIKRKE